MVKSSQVDIESKRSYIENVAWAVHSCSSHMPWKKRCMAEAIAAKMILRRSHIKSDLYLGLKKCPRNTMLAHSWLQCGDMKVIGGDLKGVHTVSFFGDL